MSKRHGAVNTLDGNQIAINVLDNPHGAIINLYGKLGVIADFDESKISFQPSNRDHDDNYDLKNLVDKVNYPETVRFITAMRAYYVDMDIEQFRLHATVDWLPTWARMLRRSSVNTPSMHGCWPARPIY